MKRFMLALLAVCGFTLGGAAAVEAKDYPAKAINLFIPWAPGGGTDVVNRMFAAEMQKQLDGRIIVSNRTGGVSGSAGFAHVYAQPADGYTLTGIASSGVTASVQGGWKERFSVWQPFIIADAPSVVAVDVNSPYQTIEELFTAAREKPRSIRASGSTAGSIYHLALVAFNQGEKVEFNYIPYEGSNPSISAAVTGEVQVVVASLSELAALMQAKRLRPLGVLAHDDVTLKGVGTIPSILQKYPGLKTYLPLPQSLGFAVRADAPAPVIARLEEAFRATLATEKVKDWAVKNNVVLVGASGEQARQEYDRLERAMTWGLQDLGIATVSPETLGIPRP